MINKLKKISIIILLLAVSFSSYARKVVIEIPEITVPNLMLPTKLDLSGKLKFENNWLKKAVGDSVVTKLKGQLLLNGEVLAQITFSNTDKVEVIMWSILFDFSNLSLSSINDIRAKRYNVKVFFGKRKLWSLK